MLHSSSNPNQQTITSVQTQSNIKPISNPESTIQGTAAALNTWKRDPVLPRPSNDTEVTNDTRKPSARQKTSNDRRNNNQNIKITASGSNDTVTVSATTSPHRTSPSNTRQKSKSQWATPAPNNRSTSSTPTRALPPHLTSPIPSTPRQTIPTLSQLNTATPPRTSSPLTGSSPHSTNGITLVPTRSPRGPPIQPYEIKRRVSATLPPSPRSPVVASGSRQGSPTNSRSKLADEPAADEAAFAVPAAAWGEEPELPPVVVVAPVVVAKPAPVATPTTAPIPAFVPQVAPIPVAPVHNFPDRNRVSTGGQRGKLSAVDLEEKMRLMKLKNEAAVKRHAAILAEETAFQTLAAEEEALSASIKAAEKIERDRIWESQRSAREAQAIADELAAVVAAQIKKELEKEKAKAKKVENEKKKEKERRTAEFQASINAERSKTASRKLELVSSRAWDREKLDSPLPPSLALALSSSSSAKTDSKEGSLDRELNYPSIEREEEEKRKRLEGPVEIKGVKEEHGWDSVPQDHHDDPSVSVEEEKEEEGVARVAEAADEKVERAEADDATPKEEDVRSVDVVVSDAVFEVKA